MALESKNGYVKNYKINIIVDDSLMEIPIFVVTLTDDKNGNDNPEEFNIFRYDSSDAVNKTRTSYWAISYSNVVQAIIATVKEAFIHREKVIIEYDVVLPRAAIIPEWYSNKNLIRSIKIYK